MGLEVKSLGKVGREGATARARNGVVEQSMRTAPLPLDSWETSNQVAPEGKFCDSRGFYFFIQLHSWDQVLLLNGQTDGFMDGWMNDVHIYVTYSLFLSVLICKCSLR